VKGSGPGGQKINKSSTCCQLKHIPTGLTVSCQRFRELSSNRKEARKLLKLKLDDLINGDQSKRAVKISQMAQKKKKKLYKSKKNLAKKMEEKKMAHDQSAPPHSGEGEKVIEGRG
jgi:peptide chain release factor